MPGDPNDDQGRPLPHEWLLLEQTREDTAFRSLVERIVQAKVRAHDSFTAHDVTRAVRRQIGSARHSDVREIVHQLFATGFMGDDYGRTVLAVAGPVRPFLFAPKNPPVRRPQHGCLVAVFLFVAVLVLAAAKSCAAEWLTPDKSVRLAYQDATRLPAESLLWTRWVWCPANDETVRQLASFSLNVAVSELRNPNVVRPDSLVAGHLLRVDLRKLAPTDPVRLAKLWDQLVDPYLYAQVKAIKPRLIDVPPYVHTDGRTYRQKWVFDERIVFGDHLADAADLGNQLQVLTGAVVPIIRVDELIRRALTALDDGLYYEFLGVPADYDEFLRIVGADEKRADELDSQRKAAILRSKVTDVPRAILVFPTISVGPDISQGNHWISQDIGKDDRDVRQHPLRNLLDNQFRAGEACTEGNNGRLIWTLWAFQRQGNKVIGRLQKSVPDDIAQDGTVQHPHDRRLQASVSCWRCHCQERHDGFKPFENHIAALAKHGIDIFGDVSRDQATSDVLKEIVSLYRWDSDKVIRRSRDDFAEFVVRATGKLDPNTVGAAITAHFQAYWYDGVGPETACRELGLRTWPGETPADAARKLREFLPPIPVQIAPGVLPEDPIVAALKAGQTITRRDWESVYQEAFRRRKSS